MSGHRLRDARISARFGDTAVRICQRHVGLTCRAPKSDRDVASRATQARRGARRPTPTLRTRRRPAGDRDAMERLLMRAQEVAYRFSLLVCGHPEDAEDVMQDALLKTYRYVSRIKEPEAFRTWLYTTVRNACLHEAAAARRRTGALDVDRAGRRSAGDGEAGSWTSTATARPADQLVIDAWIDEPPAPCAEGAAAGVPDDRRDARNGRAVDARGGARHRHFRGEREDAAASRARDAAPGAGGRMSENAEHGLRRDAGRHLRLPGRRPRRDRVSRRSSGTVRAARVRGGRRRAARDDRPLPRGGSRAAARSGPTARRRPASSGCSTPRGGRHE